MGNTAQNSQKHHMLEQTEAPKSFGAMEASLSVLQEHFGHESFLKGQEEVVTAALQGRDVAVFWTTGAGKSLRPGLKALTSSPIFHRVFKGFQGRWGSKWVL